MVETCEKQAPEGFSTCSQDCAAALSVSAAAYRSEQERASIPPGWLSAFDLAKEIGVNYFTVLTWRKNGEIIGKKFTGKAYYFNLEEVRTQIAGRSERELTAPVIEGSPSSENGAESAVPRLKAETVTVEHPVVSGKVRGSIPRGTNTQIIGIILDEAAQADRRGEVETQLALLKLFARAYTEGAL